MVRAVSCEQLNITFQLNSSVRVSGWGRDKFISTSQLMNPHKGFYLNDTLILKAEVTVFHELVHEEMRDNPDTVAIKNQTLAKCMKNLLKDETSLGDMEFIFSKYDPSTKISAHRCILMARSPVFHAMFTSQMAESVNGKVYVEDIEPNVMKELVTYMYTDSFSSEDILSTMAEDLLPAATQYGILGVIFECEAYLMQHICLESVVGLLILADCCNAATLKQHCLQYIAAHSTEVTKLSEYTELKGELLADAQTAVEATSKSYFARPVGSGTTEKRASICIVM
jgi:speckle-type POZ protein